jgi:hypothetical protein
MGGGSSKQNKPCSKSVNLYKLMKAMPHYSEQNTINFSRQDLADTLSDRSIVEAIQNGGGLKNMPKRDRYTEFATQKIKTKNENFLENIEQDGGNKGYLIGGNPNNKLNKAFYNAIKNASRYDAMEGGHQLSSVSENDMNIFKTLVNNQSGGCGCSGDKPELHQIGGCGCGENKVIKGGAFCQVHQTGGCGCGENRVLLDGGANLSATSSFAVNNNFSATSSVSNNHSATDRLMNIAQMGGANSTSDLITSLSSSSNLTTTQQPINYANIVGGNWNSYGGRTSTSPSSSSSSSASKSSTKSSSTSSASSSKERKQSRHHKSRDDSKSSSSIRSPKHEGELILSVGGATSVQSRLDKLTSVTKSHHKRSKKASSTSSEGSSVTSTVTGSLSSSSSSKKGSSSSSSSSLSSGLYSGAGTVNRNRVYLSTTMSEGNVVNAKQFYSSENGELYSSDTNYLRNNLTKRRFK